MAERKALYRDPITGTLAEVAPTDTIAGASGGISELEQDPTNPTNGSTWVLKHLEAPQGTINFIAGGYIGIVPTDQYSYSLSFATNSDGIKRVKLT